MKSARAALIVAAAAAALIASAARLRAQNPPATSQQPTFRAGVSAVRVDVLVTDRQGNPVDNLAEQDFELTEDGKPQKIDSVRLIRVQTEQQPGGEAPREIRSFDDEATELRRDDVRIIVLFLDDYHTSRMNAMRLREWLARFVNTQVGPYDVVAVMLPLMPTAGLTFTRDKYALGTIINRFEGRRGDYMPRNDMEAGYAMESPWRIEEIRNEVVLSALKSLCYRLGSLNEGRKSVIVVGETLGAMASDLQEVIDAANRNNVAFYPLEVQGLGMGGFGASGVLRDLADNSNGRAIVNRNDLEAGLASVLRDASAYYLLGYTPSAAADGKFHDIKVRVKRPGLEVRARKGYWAPTPEEARRMLAPSRPEPPTAVTAALAALAEPRGGLIRTWIGFRRADNGRSRVSFVWEPAPAPGLTASERPAGVTLAAAAPGGAPYFDGPAVSRASFDAPPGKLQIKLAIEGAASGGSAPKVFQRDTRDIVVPDLQGRAVALSTPAVMSARTTREFRTLAADPDPVPLARRQFTRVERLQIRFEAYAPAGTAPTVAARLLNQNGDQMAVLTAQRLAARPTQQMIDLPIANLPRGDYLIEISANAGGGEAKELMAFRVVG